MRTEVANELVDLDNVKMDGRGPLMAIVAQLINLQKDLEKGKDLPHLL